jgi:hypothetical protein
MSSGAPREVRVDYQHSYQLRADDTRRFLQFLKNTWRDLDVDITADTLRVKKSRPGELSHLEGEIVVEETRVDEVVEREQYLPDGVVYLLAAVGLVVAALGAGTPSAALVGVGLVTVAVAVALSVYDQPRYAEREYDVRTDVSARIDPETRAVGSRPDAADSTADAVGSTADADDAGNTRERTAQAEANAESVESAESTTPAAPDPSDGTPAESDPAASSMEYSGSGPPTGGSSPAGPSSSGPSPAGPSSAGPSPAGPSSAGPSRRPGSVAQEITVVVETSVSTPYPDATRPVVEERLETVDDRLTDFFEH